MTALPVLTAIGSCRVYDPVAMLAAEGRVGLNQRGIFGFVHSTREVIQQLDILSGRLKVQRKYRPFLNIPEAWKAGPQSTDTTHDYRFARSDCFIVEISSVRLLQFKGMSLQLNRVRDQLVKNSAVERDWWLPLLHDGRNDFEALVEAYPAAEIPEPHRTIAQQVVCVEQTKLRLVQDLLAIEALLPRPVLFVSHFNSKADSTPIRQRELIADAMHHARKRHGTAVFDPTPMVLAAGPEKALLDESHYREDFVPQVAEALLAEVDKLLTRRATTRQVRPDSYQFAMD